MSTATGVKMVNPYDNPLGITFPGIAQDWMTWLLSVNLDDNNKSEDIRYLRAYDFPKPNGDYSYVRVGENKLYVNAKKTLIVLPAITYHLDSIHEGFETPNDRLTGVLNMMNFGENPPSINKIQIKKDNGAIQNLDDAGYGKYKIVTPDFQIDIPEYDEMSGDKYLGKYLDVEYDQPGPTQIRVGGTFILFQLDEGEFLIVWNTKGENGYTSKAVVEIKSTSDSQTAMLESRFQ